MQQAEFPFDPDPPQQPQRPPSRKGCQLGPRSRSVCAYCGERVPSWTLDRTPPHDNAAGWAKIATTHDPTCRWVATKGLRLSTN